MSTPLTATGLPVLAAHMLPHHRRHDSHVSKPLLLRARSKIVRNIKATPCSPALVRHLRRPARTRKSRYPDGPPVTARHSLRKSCTALRSLSTSVSGSQPEPPREDRFVQDPSSVEMQIKPSVYRLTLAACLSMVQFGYATGIIGSALLYIESDPFLGGLTTLQKSMLVSSAPVGAMLGTVLSGFPATLFGRRWTLLFNNLLYAVGALGGALAPSVALLLYFRLFVGVAVGISTSVTTMYIAECVPARVRGMFTGYSPWAGTAGITLSFVGSLFLGSLEHNWRWMLALGALPGLLQLLLQAWLPETPPWLLANAHRDRARAVLELTGNTEELRRVTDDIDAKDCTSSESSGETAEQSWTLPRAGWRELFASRATLLPLGIGVGLNVLQQVIGINVVVYFCPKIFNQLGFTKQMSILITAAISITQLACNAILNSKVDALGRRPALFVGLGGMITGLLVLAASYSPPLQALACAPLLAIAGIFLYRIMFSVSMGPIPYIITAELFPTSVRSAGCSLSSAANWAANCMVTFTFLPLIGILTAQYVWFLYIFTCCIAMLFIYTMVPETKGTAMRE